MKSGLETRGLWLVVRWIQNDHMGTGLPPDPVLVLFVDVTMTEQGDAGNVSAYLHSKI